ncbi:dead helicase [Fusarium napiforme]|uniref:Dead helicase n=1 Tax=Fusarium napiforme TaxID=42672 RepID=A0A8H5K628_9HYPO|nr:dead helicase [Fusarium napiforme]
MLAQLEALGIRTLTVQSKHSQGERDAAVKKFNSPAYPISAMITSMKLSSLGVNFHHACCDGLIMEYPSNMGTQIQSLGRLWRMQQLKAVTWEILHQRDSYDAFLDARNCEKLAHNMAAEGNINPAITGQYRIICAYELIRAMMGHESNHYSRLRVPWFAMDSKRVRDEGFFYSALANFLFRNPSRQDLISPETIGDVAARWQLGSPLTIEHIEPGHPSYKKPLDPSDPLRVKLTSAIEQEKAYDENMREIADEFDDDGEGNENSDLFAQTAAFQDDPEEEDGFGGPQPVERELAITGSIGSVATGQGDGDVEMAGTVSKGKRKREEQPATPTKTKVPRRTDVNSARRNKL